jgi:hydroxymethylglutaryl-CoA reductase
VSGVLVDHRIFYCIFVPPSIINCTESRGKSVAIDRVVKGKVVKQVLKTIAQAIVDNNIFKTIIKVGTIGRGTVLNSYSLLRSSADT